MTSNINYLSINENFPVPGVDNDTQVFRDNFDTIKTSLRAAQTEITDLQTNTAGLALTDYVDTNGAGSDFNGNLIYNATLQRTGYKKYYGGTINSATYELGANLEIDYELGSYQIFKFESNMNIQFSNLPTNSSGASGPLVVGKITLELYGDNAAHVLTFVTGGGGAEFRRNPSWPGGNSITVTSQTAPIIVDVWRHSSNYIFMHYHGQYS
jgi:hypothetical protein